MSLTVSQVVIFGVGSPIAVDVEESLNRSGYAVAVGVRNRPGDSYLLGSAPIVAPEAVTADLMALPFIVPLFTPGNRQRAAREAADLGFTTALSLIDGAVTVPTTLQHEPGLYINSGCSLGAASRFDRFVFINRGASIGHHARFGSFVSIGPGATIAGMVTIGKGTMIGSGAVVLPEITIGSNAVVGAGAVVTRDVADHCLVLGNPARVVKSGIPGYHDLTVA